MNFKPGIAHREQTSESLTSEGLVGGVALLDLFDVLLERSQTLFINRRRGGGNNTVHMLLVAVLLLAESCHPFLEQSTHVLIA